MFCHEYWYHNDSVPLTLTSWEGIALIRLIRRETEREREGGERVEREGGDRHADRQP